MSPERLDFIDTPAGDVYALGVLLWELVTAHSYGRSSSKEARHQSRLKENLDILWETTGGESQDFITFVESLLSYEPEDRPLARDVERQCGALRMNREGQLLRDWAEVIVPPLLEAQRNPKEEDPNSATMMIGSGSNRSVADMLDELDQDFEENKEEEGLGSDQMMSKWMPPTQEFYAPEGGGAAEFELGEIDGEKGGVRRRPWWLLSGTLAVVLLLGGVGAWWHLTGSQGTQQPTQTKALQNLPAQTPAAKPVAADDAAPPGNEALPADATQESSSSEQPDPDTPPATEDTTSSASAETETETKAETESDPKTESKPKPKPKPKTSSPASKSGVVSVTGDALKVMLVSSGGKRRKAGGSIPPGSYRIEASFVDQEPINAGQLQVSPGSANVIKCSSRFRRCTSKAQ